MAENILEFLKEAKEAYYKGFPIISDDQYDALEEKYGRELEVGYDIDDGLPHYERLYSLQKYYLGEDELPHGNYIYTPKLDGASVALLYVNGKLVSALTRGDGKLGKDVTNNLKHLVLPNINIPMEVVQIRGEVVAPETIENSRNYAAGALGLKDEEEFKNRTLYFVAHEIYPTIKDTYADDMTFLGSFFITVLDMEILKNHTFPTDGKVFRLNSNEEYEMAGFTSKHPKGAFALKERSEGIPTKLLDVVWQTGKSGKVTPVAILEPVTIEDAVVSRATLNNPGFIKSLGLEIGDTVLVERAGGIIPRIISKAE